MTRNIRTQPDRSAAGRPGEAAAEEAAAWVARLTARPPTALERDAFDAWLIANPSHRPAFVAAREAYAAVDAAPSVRQRDARRSRKGREVTLGIGAALAAGLVAVVVLPHAALIGTDYRTAAGDVRELILEDGSRLWLDTKSAVDVRYDNDRRIIGLAQGRVFVEVGEGDRRPFSIETEGAVIRDVGTAFSVDRTGRGFSVAVEDGIVDVERGKTTFRLRAGEAASFAGAAQQRRRSADPDEQAWRDGRIVFDRMPVRDAVMLVGRYRRERMVWMAGPGRAPVSGVLQIDNLDEGLVTLAADNGLTLVRAPGVIVVRSKES